MKKALALLVALFTAASASAQNAQLLPLPPGQGTGAAPPVSSEFRRREPPRVGTLVVVERESLEQRLARLEALLGDAYEHSKKGKKGKSQGKLREAHAELNDIRAVLANAPDVRLYIPPQHQPQPQPQPAPAVQPIADGKLRKLMKALAKEPFAEDKLRILEEASQYNYFLVGQMAQVLPQFQFSRDRLSAVRMMWSRTLDRQNGHELYGSFQFSSDKKALKEIISG